MVLPENALRGCSLAKCAVRGVTRGGLDWGLATWEFAAPISTLVVL